MARTLGDSRILLVISGGIAAYKVLEVVRRLKERGAAIVTVMTEAATRFVTPMAVAALSNGPVHRDLWDLTREHEISHIRIARDCDIVVVAPASADILARMAGGHADDLATTILLATDKPVLAAPAMNPRMWTHPATVRNVARLAEDGIGFVGPAVGEMAERDEAGRGRLVEPADLVAAIEARLAEAVATGGSGALAGRRILVTSGPTHEPIDPVRYIANRSSGRQGHAIAAAAAAAGASVTLVSGPVGVPDPPGARVVRVETAREMLDAVERALPVDAAVMAAAVADWRVEAAPGKIKKTAGAAPPALALAENPDILATVARQGAGRPRLVVGFAAETEDVVENARAKRARKGADWILANDVGAGSAVFGGGRNAIHLVSADGVEAWPDMPKEAVARRLVERIAAALAAAEDAPAAATADAALAAGRGGGGDGGGPA